MLRYRTEAALFRLLLIAARIAPRRALLACGTLAGLAGYFLNRRHRRIALNNLRQAYGNEMPDPAARRTARACWMHLGRTTLDTLAFPRLGPSSIGKTIEVRGEEHIRGAYEKGKGVLLFSGHFGHWELTALMQGFLGLPLALVARPLDNPWLERLLADLRGRSGNIILHKRAAVREMLRALKRKIGVAIVIDQDARENGVFVPFFGRPASTSTTLALLALRTGAAVVPTYSLPRPDGSYLMVYEPEVRVIPSDNRDEDVRRITAECTAHIERWVRRDPALWLWMHRRWKTEPPGHGSGNGVPFVFHEGPTGKARTAGET